MSNYIDCGNQSLPSDLIRSLTWFIMDYGCKMEVGKKIFVEDIKGSLTVQVTTEFPYTWDFIAQLAILFIYFGYILLTLDGTYL